MNTHFRSMLAVLPAALLAGVLALPLDALAAKVAGTIDVINPATKRIRVRRANGTTLGLTVGTQAVINRNGAPSVLTRLALRDKVTVVFNAATGRAATVVARGPAFAPLSGTVAGFNVTRGTIKVGARNVRANATTLIARNGRIAPLGSLTKGDRINLALPRVVAGGTGAAAVSAAASILATGPESDAVTGAITALACPSVTVTPANGTAPLELTLGAATQVDADGAIDTCAALLVGQRVKAYFDPVTLVVYGIDVVNGEGSGCSELVGTVAAVDVAAGTISITPTLGPPDVALTVTADTQVEANGNEGFLGDVTVGMPVKAEYDPTTLVAAEINAGSGDSDPRDESADLDGTVVAVDPVAATITVTPDAGPPDIVFTITPDTDILMDDVPATVADILPAATVTIHFNQPVMDAIMIEVEQSN